jgi:hypothetical protein
MTCIGDGSLASSERGRAASGYRLRLASTFLLASFSLTACDERPKVAAQAGDFPILKLENIQVRDRNTLMELAQEGIATRNFLQVVNRSVVLLDRLITLDRVVEGVPNSGRKEEFGKLLNKAGDEIKTTFEELRPFLEQRGFKFEDSAGAGLAVQFAILTIGMERDLCVQNWYDRDEKKPAQSIAGFWAIDFRNQLAELRDEAGAVASEVFNLVSEPIYVSVGDGTLIRIKQDPRGFSFQRNASGYASLEAGVEVYGTGGSVTVPVANIYFDFSPLEALALVDFDWQRLHAVAIQNSQRSGTYVDPDLLQLMLEPLGSLKATTPTDRISRIDPATCGIEVTASGGVPIFVRLPDFNLLKITYDGQNLEFFKTSEGYASAAIKARVVGIGGEVTVPIANIYTKIEDSGEVLGYFHNDPAAIEALVALAERQQKLFGRSVPASVLRKAFL